MQGCVVGASLAAIAAHFPQSPEPIAQKKGNTTRGGWLKSGVRSVPTGLLFSRMFRGGRLAQLPIAPGAGWTPVG